MRLLPVLASFYLGFAAGEENVAFDGVSGISKY
jgi:hypothetical protein